MLHPPDTPVLTGPLLLAAHKSTVHVYHFTRDNVALVEKRCSSVFTTAQIRCPPPPGLKERG